MSEQGPDPSAEHAKPRGEAAWKAHLQAIAERNDRARAIGKKERREREEQAASKRLAEELRVEAELARRHDSR